MVITEPAAARTRLLGLASNYIFWQQARMLNKDRVRFMQSFLSTPKLSKRKKDPTGNVPQRKNAGTKPFTFEFLVF